MFDRNNTQPLKMGFTILQGAVLALFTVFMVRLWYLQIFRGQEYADRSRENGTRLQFIYAPRGLIWDRNGALLAENEPAYALSIIREDCRDAQKALEQVSRWTGIPVQDLRMEFDRGCQRVKSFEPLILVSNLTFELLARIEADSLGWPEIKIVTRPRRTYLYGRSLSHVLGYVAQANEEELNEDPELSLGDSMGKQGVELILEKSLRGRKGLRQFEVDATGRRMNETTVSMPEAGRDLVLSIDIGLQNMISGLLEGQAGAVVVMEPNTGRLWSLVSEPGYDSNLFVEGVSQAEWELLLNDDKHPLQNRAIQSAYPPGSVFKLVVAGCALANQSVNPKDEVYCTGEYQMGNRVFRCWKKHGHGSVDFRRGLVESCDVYFYRLGERLGVEAISTFAKSCGFGQTTGVELPHERAGLIPDDAWKRKRFGVSWQRGETLNMSIGQGYTLTTPIQVARFISALVNGGRLLRPSLVKDGDVQEVGKLPLSNKQRELILETMVDTVNDPRGTASRLRTKDVTIGAKTGTAQVVRLMEEFEDKDTSAIPYKYRDHAWIATFGLKGDRAFVVVAMVEHGGHGGSAAGPIAKAVYDRLFQNATAVPPVLQGH